ncbi:hypothetical protein M440DRAFT_1395453 [Trichoderma longibrachiatum ATCC 18648]|uniref:Uncharacterized protein n=1 Tax=Trichoderma longibrachiatum ATCC 18648 TaxID=983965 RepID=A0A2T4BQZ8_TRILO|nr:hypothetical protein M440DRAFT_1395453 [Trichoderma longibrachiatum ATCC 18648]
MPVENKLSGISPAPNTCGYSSPSRRCIVKTLSPQVSQQAQSEEHFERSQQSGYGLYGFLPGLSNPAPVAIGSQQVSIINLHKQLVLIRPVSVIYDKPEIDQGSTIGSHRTLTVRHIYSRDIELEGLFSYWQRRRGEQVAAAYLTLILLRPPRP